MTERPVSSILPPDLSLVLERITDGFFALDREWRIVYINGEARRLLDAPDDALGRFWLDAFPKARGRLFQREYERAMRDQHSVQFVEYSKTAHVWFECKAYPSPEGISVYFRDVTARIEAQRAVERNATQQEALIDFGRRALTGTSLSYLCRDALRTIHEMIDAPVVEAYDYDRAEERLRVREALGWASNAALDPAFPPVGHILHAVRSGVPLVSADFSTDLAPGAFESLHASGLRACLVVPIGTPNRPIGAFVVYDTSPRWFSQADTRFVEALAQTIAETASADESFRTMAHVLESIRDAFVAVDRDLCITYVNTQMARFWKLDAAAMTGLPIARLLGSEPYALETLANFRLALESQRSLTFEVTMNARQFEARLYPSRGGVAAYVRDITKRSKELAIALARNAELEARAVASRTGESMVARIARRLRRIRG